jgi:hypothetical protein
MTLFVKNAAQPPSILLVKKNVGYLIDRSTKTNDAETANHQEAIRKRTLVCRSRSLMHMGSINWHLQRCPLPWRLP